MNLNGTVEQMCGLCSVKLSVCQTALSRKQNLSMVSDFGLFHRKKLRVEEDDMENIYK